MSSPSPFSPAPDDPEHDPVWQLLDRSRVITPSPTFARTVTAAVQSANPPGSSQRPRLISRLIAFPRPAIAAAALIVGIAALTWLSIDHRNPEVAQPARPDILPNPQAIADDSESLVQSIAAEIAMLDDAEQLLDPQDDLDLEETDVDHILF